MLALSGSGEVGIVMRGEERKNGGAGDYGKG